MSSIIHFQELVEPVHEGVEEVLGFLDVPVLLEEFKGHQDLDDDVAFGEEEPFVEHHPGDLSLLVG